MAISRMTKVMIVTHRSEAPRLLEALQSEEIIQVLDAEHAMVTKEWPELGVEAQKPRGLEELLARLEKAIDFLNRHFVGKSAVNMFNPRVVVDSNKYNKVISEKQSIEILKDAEKISFQIDKLLSEHQNMEELLNRLNPWQNFQTPVEQIYELEKVDCFTGLIPKQHLAQVIEMTKQVDAALQQVANTAASIACVVISSKEQSPQVQKTLRFAEFEPISFEGMQGTVEQLINQLSEKKAQVSEKITQLKKSASELAEKNIDLQILSDYYRNLIDREQARQNAPATEHAILLEGWVRIKDYPKLEKIVSGLTASSLTKMNIAEDEEIPVEIENNPAVRPFEAITRLYGMPHPTSMDPTVFLAPFFAIFFGLCLTDAAYGLLMVVFLFWLLRKIRAGQKFVMMLLFCSIATVVAGAVTGGWCGDTVQVFIPQLNNARKAIMLFDPLEKPMVFFALSLALGYLQIMFGIFIAFVHRLRQRDYVKAVFDHLIWFIWLNSLVIFGLAKAAYIPHVFGTIFGWIALVPAVMIILLTEREGGWINRLGMGCYNLFSTVFYVGDVLSYIRLMALGMVTAGFGMAINAIVKQTMEYGFLGWIAAGIIFIGGHVFNVANSALSSFVHSMRLQFVEFFTKFIVGGGRQFEPLKNEYQYIEPEKQNSQ